MEKKSIVFDRKENYTCLYRNMLHSTVYIAFLLYVDPISISQNISEPKNHFQESKLTRFMASASNQKEKSVSAVDSLCTYFTEILVLTLRAYSSI